MVEAAALNHSNSELYSGLVQFETEVLGKGTNVAIDSLWCGLIPNELPSADVFPGGQVSGNICYVVPEEDISTVVLRWEPNFRDTIWYALR